MNPFTEQKRAFFTRIQHNEEPTQPGMYLSLFHGRTDPDQDMDDWGTDGPYFGPLKHVGFTYGRLSCLVDTQDNESGVLLNAEDLMYQHDDMVFYDGVYYGDWKVFIV